MHKKKKKNNYLCRVSLDILLLFLSQLRILRYWNGRHTYVLDKIVIILIAAL